MAVPKEKHLFQKKMRRSHHKLSSINIVEDKKSEYKLSHHIDLKSGFYNGKKSRYLILE